MPVASMSLEHRQNMLAKETREFIDAQSKQAVAEQAVETARTVLDQSINVLWLHDSTDNVLQPVAMTAEPASEPPAPE